MSDVDAALFPGFHARRIATSAATIHCVVGGSGPPRPVIDRLNAAIRASVAQDDTKAFYAKLGAELAPSTPDALAVTLRREMEKWTKTAKDIGLSTE